MSQRILYLIDSLKFGGAETLLLDLLDEAARRGDQCHVGYFSPGPLVESVAARGVEMTQLSRAGLRDPRVLFRAMGLIRRFRPDVVHTHLVKSDLIGQLAARFAGAPKRIVTFHNTNPWRKSRVLSWAYRSITSGADAYIAVSTMVADYIAETRGCGREKIHVIDNGVDLNRFDPETAKPLDLGGFGISEDAFSFGIIGRLSEQKDHLNFLDAARRVADALPQARFLVVGDGPLRPMLEARAAELGLTPERLVFAGVLHDMPGLLASLQAVTISSRWEGLPMTLLEAMAMRRPVVSTAVGGVPDLIEDGRDGLLVPAADAESLADAMIRVASEPDLRDRIGAAGRATVAQKFDKSTMSRRLEALYTAPRDTAFESSADGRHAYQQINPGE